MPLVDMVGPFGTDHPAGLGRADWIIADLGMTLRMGIDARTKMTCHHLSAEADTEIRLLVAQRHTDPIDFPMHKIFVVVRALRAAEDRGTGMVIHGFRQRIAKAWAPDVEWIAELRQSLANAAGR